MQTHGNDTSVLSTRSGLDELMSKQSELLLYEQMVRAAFTSGYRGILGVYRDLTRQAIYLEKLDKVHPLFPMEKNTSASSKTARCKYIPITK